MIDLPHLRRLGLVAAHPGYQRPPLPHLSSAPWKSGGTCRGAGSAVAAAGAIAAALAPSRLVKPSPTVITVQTSTGPMATEEATHGQLLPEAFSRRIPEGDLLILNFILAFLSNEGLSDVPLFVNGGYVRDLLLGKEPDDLDLSLCLKGCAPEVSVAGLLEQMPGFAASRPDLKIVEVKIATILSNESKDKALDTFKAHLTDTEGRKTEVDVMPTIGEEKYSNDNRIPIRDQRGTPEEDCLRRDLTIGALLLRVLPPRGAGGSLQYELSDFYGGVQDLRAGILRSPCPLGRTLEDVQHAVLRTAADRKLAQDMKLQGQPEALQALWWAKVLMDDPLRICRALRFAAKLRFKLHDAFWLAVPFALEHLRAKVAGSRKNTEYQKIGSYGYRACEEFFELAFTKTFGPDKGELRLAAALMGGQDDKGTPRTLSEVIGFDLESFRALSTAAKPAAESESAKSAPELIGGLMATAINCAQLKGSDSTLAEFNRACDGMSVSNAMREAGALPLQAATAMVGELPSTNSLDAGVAAACGQNIETWAQHIKTWEALRVCAPRAGPPDAARHRVALALGLMRKATAGEEAERVSACASVLSFQRPPVKGAVLTVLNVPPPLRGQVMLCFEVALRVLQYGEPIETAEHLETLFTRHPDLRVAFAASVWFEDDGKTLRPQFQPPRKGGGDGKEGKRQKP